MAWGRVDGVTVRRWRDDASMASRWLCVAPRRRRRGTRGGRARVSRHRRDAERGDRATRNAGFWVSKDNAPQGPSNEAENVYLDSHIYACFVDDLKAMTPQQHIRQVCKFERDHIVQTRA